MAIDSLPQLAVEDQALMRPKHNLIKTMIVKCRSKDLDGDRIPDECKELPTSCILQETLSSSVDMINIRPITSFAPWCILSAAAVVKAICHAANDEAHAVQFMIIDSLPQLAVEGQALMRSKHYPNSRRVQGATNFMHPAGDSIQLSPFNNTSIAPRCILSAAAIVKAICHAAFTTTISEESQSLAYHGQGGYPKSLVHFHRHSAHSRQLEAARLSYGSSGSCRQCPFANRYIWCHSQS